MPEPNKQPPTDDPDQQVDAGRARLRRALGSRPSRGQAIVGVLLACVGFAAMTQVQSNERDDDYTGLRQEDLIRVFDGLSASSERARNEIDRLRRTREELQSSTSRRQAALDQARKDAAVYGILAGTVPTVGPGVRITITDTEGTVEYSTLLDTLQELRAAGAEAIEVNDRVRVIAQTSIQETPLGIEFDGELIEAPYVFDVIGEPATLAGSLDFPSGPVERVSEEGGSVEFDEPEEVVIESVVKRGGGEFAEPRADQ